MIGPEDTPRYLLASTADAAAVLRRLARSGWTTRDGFAVPEPAWDLTPARLALTGRVADADTAELALLAAVRGTGIIAIADTRTDVGRAFLADLSRIGPVHTDPGEASSAQPGSEDRAGTAPDALAPEHRALLDRLAAGETIASAAVAEYLSLRTANRRIAEARTILGTRTTREAVMAYVRLRRGGIERD